MLVATKLDDSIVLTPEVRVLMLSGAHPASCCASFASLNPAGHCWCCTREQQGQMQTLTATLPLSQALLPVCHRCCSSGWAPAECGHGLLWRRYSLATMRSAPLHSVLNLR